MRLGLSGYEVSPSLGWSMATRWHGERGAAWGAGPEVTLELLQDRVHLGLGYRGFAGDWGNDVMFTLGLSDVNGSIFWLL